jgi:hypothetical protein
MADVIQDAQQEFWRSPTVAQPAAEIPLPSAVSDMADACSQCGAEFMIQARFCHTCGRRRPLLPAAQMDSPGIAGLWSRSSMWFGVAADSVTVAWRKISFPRWLQYLHFHEIKRWVGLPTAALVAFMIGIGCVAGALGVSFFYKASNLAEFQAIQMWRIEWLLASTASFVAGILLKKPSGTSQD